MANRTGIMVVAALVIAALATIFMDQKGDAPKDLKAGESLLSAPDLAKAQELTLKQGETTLTLKKSEQGIWGIVEDDHFPADAEKVIRFLEKLPRLKVVRSLKADEPTLERLEIGPESPHLALKGEGLDFQLTLGKARDGGGKYLRLGEEPLAYLVGEALSLEVEAKNWQYKTLADVAPDAIKKILLTPKGEDPMEFSREKPKDPFNLKGLASDEKLKDLPIGALKNSLQKLTFTDRQTSTPAYQKALPNAPSMTFTTFEDQTYTVKVVVLEEPSDQGKKEEDKEKGPSKKYYLHLETSDPKRAALKDLMAKWQFEVTSFVANNFLKKRQDLVEKTKS